MIHKVIVKSSGKCVNSFRAIHIIVALHINIHREYNCQTSTCTISASEIQFIDYLLILIYHSFSCISDHCWFPKYKCLPYGRRPNWYHISYSAFKGILWDRRWIAPSIGIFSHTCGYFYRNAFLIMKLSNPPSF